MTPKEKAEELLEKIFCITPEYLTNDECVKFAKQCALIAVDEMLRVISTGSYNETFYRKVKEEIENL